MSRSHPAAIPLPDPDPQRETPNEWTTVERPLLQQLAALGWEYLQGDLDYPQKTFRKNFHDVLLRNLWVKPFAKSTKPKTLTKSPLTGPSANWKNRISPAVWIVTGS